ncbi:MAG: tetratricopeptide repeat protein [Desulfobacterales bacterium]|nr:MAG: tetratricopeptide repeat protein [Desulfobacterales bacterium]
MKKIVILLTMLCITTTAAWGKDAWHFYNRGLESRLSYKKIEYFTKALQMDPNLVEAFEQRAIHYYFQRRFDQAIEDFSSVIKLKPDTVNGYFMRAKAFLKKAHGQGMMAEINRLIHRYRTPGEPEDRASLEKAISDFTHAIELDSQMAGAYSYRAEAYRLNGKIDKAILDVTKTLQLQGDQKSIANAYRVLAEINRQMGQNEQYEAAYSKYVELDPYSPDYPPLNVPIILKAYTPNTNSLKAVGRFGLLGIIGISFVLIFRLKLKAPKKSDKNKPEDLDNL